MASIPINKIYSLDMGYFDKVEVVYFEGPHTDNWNNLVKELVPQAANNALENQNGQRIDYSDIYRKELITLLAGKGYNELVPEETIMVGGGPISSMIDCDDHIPKDTFRKIVKFNKTINPSY